MVLNQLSFVHGDPDVYVDALAEGSEIVQHEIRLVDDDRFYVYLQEANAHERPSWWTAFLEHDLIHVPPVVVEDLEAKWDDGTRAQYLIRPREGEDGAGEIAGAACLIVDRETQTATPGIWLRKRFWGRGYSGERAAALIELAFDRLDLDLVAIPVEDGNEKSRSAVEGYVERFGGGYDGVIRNATVRPDGRIVDRHRYTITREQYGRGEDSSSRPG
ncbi:GNAT family N-acetyltransferase [Natrialba sp. INN-245]|nr:GNAT family N-acetyltransferase [Natrialba sp. INN-245]